MAKSNFEIITKKNENFEHNQDQFVNKNDINQEIKPKTNHAVSTQITENNTINDSQQQPDKHLDPTHFGDWQINCKTIDF